MPVANSNPLNYVSRNPHSFVFFKCNPNEINNVILLLKNKKCSVSEIPVSIYKKITDIISPIISNLMNSSLSRGIFPNSLKLARVVPIHKSGSKKDVKNYRPISILPIMSKIFEKIVYKRVTNFFNKFKLFYPDQYGFQNKKSTTDAIIKFTDQCYDILNNQESLISVYLDFSKAFDTVDHNLLCKKLELYGIRGSVNNWFRSYLCSREQFVQIHSDRSSRQPLSYGVPQGSVLGPLLFLIYINDMHKCTNLKLIHFADDSTAFMYHKDITYLTSFVNAELLKIDEWICSNRLSLNASKTFYSLFSNKKTISDPNIVMRNTIIARSSCQKFLGVQLDEKLNFKIHINSICQKITRSIGIIWKLSSFLPAKILYTIYYSIIYPHLIYAVEVWGKSSKVAVNRLSKKVLRAQSLVLAGNNNNELDCKMLTFTQIHEQFCLTRLFAYYKLDSNPYFSNKFTNQVTNHTLNTRNNLNNLFRTPVINSSKVFNSFFYNAINFWNKLPTPLRNVETIHAFKKKVKEKYL